MIREHAMLEVLPGREQEFEAAMERAAPLIAASPGFGRLTVSRGIETSNHYLLLVEWADLESHTEGFRGSPAYEQWGALLHHFYDPFPVVEHFTDVANLAGGNHP